MIVKNRAKEYMKIKKISIRELSRRIDHDFESTRRFVNNMSPTYTRDMLLKVSLTLDVTLAELLYIDMDSDV